MGDRVRVVHDDGGRLVAAKSPPPDDPNRGRREAEILGQLRHPGVVELVGLVDRDGSPEVHTRWVGSRSTADLARPLPPGRVAGLVVAVAATILDLHALGVVHGGLDPSHVLLDPYGRPVLCGFGDARRLDATRDERGPARPSDDVAGLGLLLADLLATEPDNTTLRRGAHADGRRRDDRRARAQRRALLGVAAQATGPDPACRPGLQAFVDAVRRAVPDAALGRPWEAEPNGRTDDSSPTADRPSTHPVIDPALDPLARLLHDGEGDRPPTHRVGGARTDDGAIDHDGPLDHSTAPPHHRREPGRTPVTVDGATRVIIDAPRVDEPVGSSDRLFGDIARLRPPDDDHRRSLPVGPVAAVGGVAALALAAFFGVSAWLGGTSSATAPSPAPRVASSTAASPDVGSRSSGPADDADADADADGMVVEHDGRRYAVGEPGDVVAVGDWHCTGRAVPAVLRPGTGALFVFWSWPEPGAPHAREPQTNVPGGTTLEAGAADSAGCAPLVVRDARGAITSFDAEAWR